MADTTNQIVARRYAKALFELALSEKSFARVENDLAALYEAAKSDADFSRFLRNPLLSRQAKTHAMQGLLEKAGAENLTKRFVRVLAQANRLQALPAIFEQYRSLCAAERGEIEVKARTAIALSKTQQKQIKDAIAKQYGRDVVLETETDPSLLGGLVLHIGDRRVDYSLAGQLRKLENTLKQPASAVKP